MAFFVSLRQIIIKSMQELELKTTIHVCQPEELTPEEQQLLQSAIEATERSYTPYSHFRVGAAVKLDNGKEITGSNQENAVAARGTNGELTEEPTGPCGGCRQVILESETRAGHPIRILLYGRKYVYVIDGIRSLMPLSFSEF